MVEMVGSGEHRAPMCPGARNVSPSQILLAHFLIAWQTAVNSGHRRTLGTQSLPSYYGGFSFTASGSCDRLDEDFLDIDPESDADP